MTIAFTAPTPGAWLREDLAAILTALSIRHNEPDYLDALRAVAVALGLKETPGTVAQHYGPVRYNPNYTAVVEVLP